MTNKEIQNAYVGDDLVDKIYLGDELIYPTTPVYSAMPLTFDIISGGTIGWVKDDVNGAQSKTIEYRINNGNWSSITSSQVLSAFSVNSGDRVEFRGNNTAFGANGYSSYFVASDIRLNVEGNIMSLLSSSGYQNMTAMTSANTYAFYNLFQNVGIVSAKNLILPATTLASSCYACMFRGCTSLTTAPELPAKSMEDYCYASMFENCTSLTTAPEMSARTVGRNCFLYMFRGCTNLTTPPILPAKYLKESCYQEMFANCTSLTTAPELPATILSNYCYQGMFRGCTSLTTAPELLATSRYTGCYIEMFRGSGVNYIKCLLSNPGSASEGYCTDWLRFAPEAGTFVKNPSASWSRGYNGIPTGWTVQDADM